MKARILVCTLLVLSLTCVSSAQLSGNYTIDPAGSGSNNYTTWAAAVSALGAGVSGNVVFTVASTTFNESVTINPITGTSASATVTFQAVGSPAILDAGAAQDGLALNTTCSYLIFDNIEVKNFTRYGLNMAGGSSSRATFCTFKNCKFDAPATSSSSTRTLYLYYPNDCTFEDCVFAGGGYVLYSQQKNRTAFRRCEFDGKGQSSRLMAPYNSNDADNLYENCFIHDCGPSGLGVYINLSQYGNMFWHNTIIMSTSQNAVHLGGCCAWSRANSFRNNIVVNTGTGVCIKYGASSAGVLEFNDADYNCYYAPNGNACELESGSSFTKGTLAQWLAYFAANPSLVPAGGGTSWDQNSIEMNPALVSMTAPYDIHLTAGSPCVDAGTTTYVAGSWISYNPSYVVLDDFEGDIRPATNVDIGADESMVTMLTGSGTGKIGTTVNLFLDAGVGDAGLPYQLGSSFGSGPIPIDTRLLGLSVDDLLVISVNGWVPAIFQNFSGVLDASGKATAAINIPNFAALDQLRIYTAFVTIKVGAPSNIQTISNTFVFTCLQ